MFSNFPLSPKVRIVRIFVYLNPTLIHGKHCSNSNIRSFGVAFMEENNRFEQFVGLFEKTVPVTFFTVGKIRITDVGTIFESKINNGGNSQVLFRWKSTFIYCWKCEK